MTPESTVSSKDTGKEKALIFGGTVERIIFHNADNGYTILRVKPDAKNAGRAGIPTDSLTCVGTMLSPQAGMKLDFTGHWVLNSRYGRQFSFTNAQEKIPTSEAGLIAYLSSGLIKGVGPDLAQRIVDRFGASTVDVLDKDTKKLLEVSGIGQKSLEKIAKSWTEHRNMRELMLALQPFGISPAYAVRIFNEYGSSSLHTVRENPYRLAMDIRGIGFITADSIAFKMGIEKQDPLRLQAGLLYILQTASENGDVYLPESQLVDRASHQLDVQSNALSKAVTALENDQRIVVEEMPEKTKKIDVKNEKARAVYLSTYYTCEAKTAFYLQRLKQMPRNVIFQNRHEEVEEVISKQPFKLAQAQSEAIRLASSSKVMILTGGPGTGKTTIIKAIITLFEKETHRILLAAPTGRAAKRMSEATQHEAKTLHRLLEYNPQQMEFARNEDTPLACDLLIVDEASMMDILLFYHLLKAVPMGAVVIFVGDIYQLPSVGPGSVLSDIIASKFLPVAELNEIFRQSISSDIIVNAHLINKGEMPSLLPPKNRDTDFYFMNTGTPEEAAKLIVDLVSRRLPKHYAFNPFLDIQVLTPMHKGAVGSANMNQLLQAALNPNGLELKRGDKIFRQGDKVMQIKNNYEKDIFNGDIGQIEFVDKIKKSLSVRFDDELIEYDSGSLDELVPAYAISIHKSQGSEYPAVIIPLMLQHFIMLQRNLVYTGITRGKKLVVLVGDPKALALAVHNNNTKLRFTRLAWRLSQYTW